MQALVFDEPGPAEKVLKLEHVPVPECGPDDVLIRVSACVIQPADQLFIAGTYAAVRPMYPQVAGFEGVGVIESAGPAVCDIGPGQRVTFRSPGAWAQFAIAPRARVYPVPAELSERLADPVACQFPLNPLTAWGLLDGVPRRPGMRVLLTAGRSAVASILDELATRRGLQAERLVREAQGYRLINHAGVTLTHAPTVEQALSGIEPYQIVFDPVGGPETLALIARTASGGYLVSYGVLDDRAFEVKASTVLYRSLHWQGFAISAWLDRAGEGKLTAAAAECWAILAEYPELLPVADQFPLPEFRTALVRAQQSTNAGKVVFKVG